MSRSQPQGASDNRPTKTLDLDDNITFGKYKGWLIKDLVEHNPQYLLWCQENISWFDLHSDVLEVIEENEIDREFNQVIHEEIRSAFPRHNNWGHD